PARRSALRAPPTLPEAVSDRPHGLDEVSLLFPEFRPEAANMYVDGPRPAVILVSPDSRQQDLPGKDLAGVLGEKLQEFVFHVREVQRAALDGGLIRV